MSNEKSPEKLDFKGFPGLASYAGDGGCRNAANTGGP